MTEEMQNTIFFKNKQIFLSANVTNQHKNENMRTQNLNSLQTSQYIVLIFMPITENLFKEN